ncbi:MAG: hypothetical protein KIS88_07050 [Anaerolineales bacterium]|nr:hypothetical protein [Anaerolineales bacterium]
MQREFNFTNDDLTANQARRLSPRQQKELQGYLAAARKGVAVSLGLTLSAPILILGLLLALAASGDELSDIWPAWLAAGALYFAIFGVFVAVDARRRKRLREQQVQEVHGRPIRHEKQHKGLTAYYVTIGDVRFQVQPEQYREFKDNSYYRVYYLVHPPTNWILSLYET